MIHITDCDRHLTKQDHKFDKALRRTMRWEALKTMNDRSSAGVFFLFFGFLYLGLYVPPLRDHKISYFLLAAIGVLTLIIRIAVSLTIDKKGNQEKLEKYEAAFFIGMIGPGLFLSTAMLYLFYTYGIEWYVWIFYLYIVCITIGGFSTYAMWRRLAFTYGLVCLVPSMIGAFISNSEIGNILVFLTILYGIFIFIQIRRWNVEAWHNRINIQLLSKRAEELAEEKLISDEANKAKTKFLSSMSHELRTPLNVILGFSQLMKVSRHSDLNEYQEKNMDQIIRSGELLLSLIDGVLDFSRMEAGRMNLNHEHFFPSEIMQECLEMLRNNAAEKNITLSGKKESDAGIYADRLRFKQVIINLITNAIKYNKDGGEVIFGCVDLPNGNVEIYVRDTGHGIPTDQLNKIFDPFERLEAVNSEIEGTGIGLTISKKLIETMGGQISATSEEGVGSRFSIEMPAATPDIIPKAIPSESEK